jgi:excisionase family DNA binding protein
MSREQLIDVNEVATYLYLKKSTVYTWVQEGFLPAFRLGRLWRFRRADLDRWLVSNRHRSIKDEGETR